MPTLFAIESHVLASALGVEHCGYMSVEFQPKRSIWYNYTCLSIYRYFILETTGIKVLGL